MKYFFLLMALPCLVSSCREPKDLEFRDFKNLSLENLSFSSATLKIDLLYYNPNNFGVELNKSELDVFLDSTFLGHSLQEIPLKVPRRQEFTVPLSLELDMKNLLKNGLTSLFNKQVSIHVLGKVKIGKAGVLKNFNVDFTTLQTIPFFK